MRLAGELPWRNHDRARDRRRMTPVTWMSPPRRRPPMRRACRGGRAAWLALLAWQPPSPAEYGWAVALPALLLALFPLGLRLVVPAEPAVWPIAASGPPSVTAPRGARSSPLWPGVAAAILVLARRHPRSRSRPLPFPGARPPPGRRARRTHAGSSSPRGRRPRPRRLPAPRVRAIPAVDRGPLPLCGLRPAAADRALPEGSGRSPARAAALGVAVLLVAAASRPRRSAPARCSKPSPPGSPR